ncbi:MAG: protein arginine kinase activator [Planctomycetota bacterium]|jgi:protein arginine kinase activator
MICQNCQKTAATVHVTEIPPDTAPEGSAQPVEHHLCEGCAVHHNVPHAAVPGKSMADIWKLLKKSAQHNAQKRQTVQCTDCGMTLEGLMQKGRLGCAACYVAFETYLGEHFERMHGAREHVGRLPGRTESQLGVEKAITNLREELEMAIEEEAYERAASIRDQLRNLEEDHSESS